MDKKRLALVGYGKMGRMIGELAPEYGFDLVARLTSANTQGEYEGAEAAIEFSTPDAAPANLIRLANAGVPAVCGTTGWLHHLPDVRRAVEENATALLHSANFSVGVAIFRRITALAAELMKDRPEYGAWAWEIHHLAKKDSPSGTMLRLIETMREHGYEAAIDLAANRGGKHPGTHEIGFDSAADTITLRHTARSREGFARGALQSAVWIAGRKGVFTFEDVLFSVR